jgi:hypothetical protein
MPTLRVSSETHRPVLFNPAAVEDVVAGNQHTQGEVTKTPVRVSRCHPQAEGTVGREPQQQSRVRVRVTGSFNITVTAGTIQRVSSKHRTVLQRAEGYGYLRKEMALSFPPRAAPSAGSANAQTR